MPISAILKPEKITAATVEILDRFRHPGFSAFQGSAIQPDGGYSNMNQGLRK
jgi:hypothetical protein